MIRGAVMHDADRVTENPLVFELGCWYQRSTHNWCTLQTYAPGHVYLKVNTVTHTGERFMYPGLFTLWNVVARQKPLLASTLQRKPCVVRCVQVVPPPAHHCRSCSSSTVIAYPDELWVREARYTVPKHFKIQNHCALPRPWHSSAQPQPLRMENG